MNTDTEQSWDGWWWFPEEGERDEQEAPYGLLSFDEEAGPQLRLVFQTGTDPFGAPGVERKAIHGITVSGRPMSVLDAHQSNWEGHLGAGHVEEWLGDLIVEGEHVPSLDEFHVDDLRVRILGLREWLTGNWHGPPGFVPFPAPVPRPRTRRHRRDLNNSLRDRRRIRRNAGRVRAWRRLSQEPGSSRLDATVGTDLRLVADVSERGRTSRYSRQTETDASLWVRSPAPRPLPEILEQCVDRFVNLLVCALGNQARVEGMTVTRYEPVSDFIRRGLPPGRTQLPREVRIYTRPWPRLRRGRPNYESPMMPRRALGLRAEEVLSRWWNLMDRLDPAQTMLFGVWNAHAIYIENSLLNLTSFAEGYHERLHDRPRLDPVEHRTTIKELLKPLPAHTRHVYRQALGYAFRQTQRERLTEVVDRAAIWIPAIAPNSERLVVELIATRNHLTHWGAKTAEVLDDGRDLWEAVERLSAALRVNLLLDLDMEPDAIEYGFLSRYGSWEIFRGS